MRRIAAMSVAAALLAGACSGGNEGTNGTGNGQIDVPEEGPVPAVEGVEFRENPQGIPVPDIPAENPGEGGRSTEIAARLLAAQTEPLGNRPPRPLLLLARSPQEANLIFPRLPRGARDLVTAHTDWQTESLLLFTGGAQPDPSYSVHLRSVGVIGGGTTLQVFGRFRVKEDGAAAQVVSEPWVLAAVPARFVLDASECLLVYPQTTPIQTSCH